MLGSDTLDNEWISLKANKVLSWNNIETLTIDLLGEHCNDESFPNMQSVYHKPTDGAYIMWMMQASKPGPRKVTWVLRRDHPIISVHKVLHYMRDFPPPKVCVGGEYGVDTRAFVWEMEPGKTLLMQGVNRDE